MWIPPLCRNWPSTEQNSEVTYGRFRKVSNGRQSLERSSAPSPQGQVYGVPKQRRVLPRAPPLFTAPADQRAQQVWWCWLRDRRGVSRAAHTVCPGDQHLSQHWVTLLGLLRPSDPPAGRQCRGTRPYSHLNSRANRDPDPRVDDEAGVSYKPSAQLIGQ